MTERQIFTLDARDNVLLEVLSKDVGKDVIYKCINNLFDEMVDLLAHKGILYADLKNALIPHQDKREIAFVFDRLKIKSGWYGNDVFKQVIPILSKGSSHSMLAGDMLSSEKNKEKVKEEFLRSLIAVNKVDYEESHQFYVVYINNLTDEMLRKLDNALSQYAPYAGFLDMTHESFMKTYLSTVLVNCCLKSGRIVIFGHEPDRSNDENVNMSGYAFDENGYICKSLSDDYYGLFLSYKIERQAFLHERDALFSLNALTRDAHPVSDLDIVVEPQKLLYLLRKKESNLKRAELLGLGIEEIASFIKEKIQSNYIYNLTYLVEYDTLKFNLILDIKTKKIVKAVRVLLALEYKPQARVLRLITLF